MVGGETRSAKRSIKISGSCGVEGLFLVGCGYIRCSAGQPHVTGQVKVFSHNPPFTYTAWTYALIAFDLGRNTGLGCTPLEGYSGVVS
jgi:hypothetical protein